MGNPQTITLNGRQYDALSGKMLDDQDKTKSNITPKPKHLHPGKNIDGFLGHVKKNVPIQRKTVVLKPTEKPKQVKDDKHKAHAVAPHIKKVPERSKTLMRAVVHKPEPSPESKKKIKPSAQYRERLSGAVVSSVAAAAPAKEALAARAHAIQKSNLVTKFGDLTTPPKAIKPDPNQIQTTANSEIYLKKLNALSEQEVNQQINTDIFEEAALKLANSYQSLKRKHTPFYEKIATKLHLSNLGLLIVSILVAIVVILGVLTYTFMGSIETYVATEKTGVHAVLPSYTPSGFGLGKVQYYTASGSTGSINFIYNSNSDSRNYVLTEQTSTTDSQGLVQSVIQASVGSNYQTYQINGRSVYFYQNYAVWVDGGLYYRIANNANLTNDQMIQIIGSI